MSLTSTAKEQISLGLIAAFSSDDDRQIAFVLNNKSFAKKADKNGGHLNWSDVAGHHQIPLALFHTRWKGETPEVYLFSVSDSAYYQVKWSRNKSSMDKRTEKATERFGSLMSGPYLAQPDDWVCQRCAARVVCPLHLIETKINLTK